MTAVVWKVDFVGDWMSQWFSTNFMIETTTIRSVKFGQWVYEDACQVFEEMLKEYFALGTWSLLVAVRFMRLGVRTSSIGVLRVGETKKNLGNTEGFTLAHRKSESSNECDEAQGIEGGQAG